jgi:chromosome segregation protein
MRLEKIKLSGFKSFVDPTVIPVHGNLTAIVGPNGCGKSNIIDAIRWVMGESSAKHLRGDNMADVIFNGSSTRKPVSTASVELVFDNSEGKIGGEYAQYDKIAIKRQVSRDGQSVYVLNGAKCRRKDITDIFLGTGLGARSYAIIEQGTISRMVEAKPEDLRTHIEEAAGISKYKERRSETETRMKHTRENLERLNDLRDEVDKQIKHLQKQAEKAEKYTELKKQERQYKLELLAMRWNIYHSAAQAMEAKLQDVTLEHNRLYAQLRELSASLESKRSEYKLQQQELNQIQSEYYTAMADVSSLEQTIRFNETSHEETLQEINRSRQQAEQSQNEIENDLQAIENLRQTILETEAILETAVDREQENTEAFKVFQEEKSSWQEQWENYRNESARHKEKSEIQRLTISQLENSNQQLQNRLDKLGAENGELSANEFQIEIDSITTAIELIETQRAGFHDELEQYRRNIGELRETIKNYHNELHNLRTEQQQIKGKITSLELLQQHAMGKDNKNLSAWLELLGLTHNRRLAEALEVAPGWETAIETVLAGYLDAICTDNAEPCIQELQQLHDSTLTLFETQPSQSPAASGNLMPLLDKISSPWDLSPLLTGIYCADDSHSARAYSKTLKPYESVVTPDGAWFGPGWISIKKQKDAQTGVLQREKDLRQLKQRQEDINTALETAEHNLHTAEQQLKGAEANRESLQQQFNSLGAELSAKQSEASAISARLDQQQRRVVQINHEQTQISEELAGNNAKLAEARQLLSGADNAFAKLDNIRQALEKSSEELKYRLEQAEHAANEAKQQVYSISARLESLRASETLTGKQIERLQQQQEQALSRISELQNKLEQNLAPIDGDKNQLVKLNQDKQELEDKLKNQRYQLETIEAQITSLAEDQTRVERDLEKQRGKLDSLRLDLQESKVRQQSVNEQLAEIDANADEVLKSLPENADEPAWKRKVDELTAQIERLGTINLTAIEEFQTQSERMKFLDEQHADLTEALHTLDQAISKIDKESKLRFQETFDKINNGLQEKFPKLFGGGQAYLELTEDDLLESGVTIMARPPGKRNSSIHLLSGGEKALTAVALVFSIFELNPAPFCLLDEVDAPLDDANVGRFSQMVEAMSESVQFLYISHNKVTMEIAKQLAGVTMKEPGVSRMVAVDIDEAISLAES